MKNTIFPVCFAVFISLLSCESNSGRGNVPQQPQQASPNVLNTTTDSSNTNSTAPSSSVQLNPAHGAPGHRCELAVGAPLNLPVTTTTPTTTSTEVIQTPTTVPVPVKTEPAKSTTRLNPAHGQPGHNCAKEVGKPL